MKKRKEKLVVVGDINVGKTSLIKRFVHNIFSRGYRATVGVDFALKILQWTEDTQHYAQFWDIAGQERPGNMCKIYFKHTMVFIVVFDFTCPSTFQRVQLWVDLINRLTEVPFSMILVGNKIDLDQNYIMKSDIENLMHKCNFVYFYEVSALKNYNVEEAFLSAIKIADELHILKEKENPKMIESTTSVDDYLLLCSDVCICRVKDMIEQHKGVNIYLSPLSKKCSNTQTMTVKWQLHVMKNNQFISLYPLGSQCTFKSNHETALLQDKIGNHFIIQKKNNNDNQWIKPHHEFKSEKLLTCDYNLAVWYLYVGHCTTGGKNLCYSFKNHLIQCIDVESEFLEYVFTIDTTVDYRDIANTLVWTNITALTLTSNLQLIPVVTVMKEYNCLNKLVLYNCSIDSKLFKILLNELHHNKSLNTLDVSGNQLTTDDIANLFNFISTSHIQELDISYNRTVGVSLYNHIQIFLLKNSPLSQLKALGYPTIKHESFLLDALLYNHHLVEFYTDLPEKLQYNINLILQRNKACLDVSVDEIMKQPLPSFQPLTSEEEHCLYSMGPIKFDIEIFQSKYLYPLSGRLIVHLSSHLCIYNGHTSQSTIFTHNQCIHITYSSKPHPMTSVSDGVKTIQFLNKSDCYRMFLVLSRWSSINREQMNINEGLIQKAVVPGTQKEGSLLNANIRKKNRFGDGLQKLNYLKVQFYDDHYQPNQDLSSVLLQHVGSSLHQIAFQAASDIVNVNKQNGDVLNEEEIASVYIYTTESPFYGTLNTAMRLHPNDWLPYQEYIYYLTKALTLLPPFEGIVYRGMDCQLSDYEVGKTIVWTAFSSSTKNLFLSLQFLKNMPGTVFFINSKTARDIMKYSAVHSEDEVLFLPNSTFKIISQIVGATRTVLASIIQKNGGYLDDKVLIYELEELL